MAKKTIRRLGLTASLVAMLGMASSAHAQWIVNDPAHQIQNIMTQLKDMAEKAAKYAKDYAHYASVIQHYQQQLIKLQGMLSMVQLPASVTIQKVDENSYMVAEMCHIEGGFSLQSLGTAIGINPNGNIIDEQRRNCVTMQRMRNRKHNETVDYLTTTLGQMQAEVSQLNTRRNMSNENGAVEANNNDALRQSVNIEANIQQWEARMAAYDGYIASIENTQQALARTALNGRKTTIGTVVKTVALKTALDF